MESLKFGVTAGGGADLVQNVQRAESLGYDDIWAGEHVIWRSPTADALMTLAAAASVTKRIRLGTAILLLPLKHPVLVAKAVTTLDHISGGRVTLGIGVGGEYPKEFEALGVPVNERGPRTNESLRLMKRLWTEDKVTFEGKFFNMKDISMRPQPVQKPHPPVWSGGRGKALERCARYCDGWLPYMYSPEMYKKDWPTVQELAEKHGRKASAITPAMFVFVFLEKDYESGLQKAAQGLGGTYGQDFSEIAKKYAVFGTPQQCAERLNKYVEAGARHFVLAGGGSTPDGRPGIEVMAKEMIPLVRKG